MLLSAIAFQNTTAFIGCVRCSDSRLSQRFARSPFANTDVTINAVNKGALPHTFTIPDVADTGSVNPGDTKSVKVNLPAGEYDFDCSEPGHKEAGMVGKLTVVEGGGQAAAAQGTPQEVAGAATPQTAGAPGESAEGTPVEVASEQLPTSYEVDMVDIAFNPTEFTIPANTDVTIKAVNNGALPHTFTIPDVADTGDVASGASAEVTVNLPPGEYEFICTVPGHKEAGMVGKVIVVESSGTAASPEASPVASPQASPAGQSVDIDMVELRFIPDTFEIPANADVQINLSNSGNLPHNFSIKDQDVSVDLAAGDKTTFVINLPPVAS